jgi:apolipoprotein N-acyltransferase
MMNVLPAMIYLCFSRRFSRSEEERRLWRNFSLAALAAAVGLFVLPSTTVVDRLALYLTPLQLVVLGRLPQAAPLNGRPNAQLLLAVLAYSAAVQFVWLNYATHSEGWVPYRSYILPADER